MRVVEMCVEKGTTLKSTVTKDKDIVIEFNGKFLSFNIQGKHIVVDAFDTIAEHAHTRAVDSSDFRGSNFNKSSLFYLS